MSYKLPLFAAAAFLGGYMLISNRQLRVNKYELKVSKLPENFVGKKILLLADLHKKRYGDNFNNLVNSCIAAEPDFILFAGDLYSRDETDMITKDELTKLLGEPDRSECNFLLSHTPLAFRAYADWGADVTFSGHCHGGVIRLPFIGGILSPERKFFPRYTKGIYELNAEQGLAKLAVTAGLGKFRLNNPSEIMICTLERQE